MGLNINFEGSPAARTTSASKTIRSAENPKQILEPIGGGTNKSRKKYEVLPLNKKTDATAKTAQVVGAREGRQICTTAIAKATGLFGL
jgi:hypothetical protein